MPGDVLDHGQGPMSWEVNGVTAKPQPDLELGTSGGEKEKRLL